MSSELRRRALAWGDGLVLGVIGALAAVFFFWTSTSNRPVPREPGPEQDYYNMLVRGLRSGHLYMDAVPDPALLALPADKRPGTAPYLLDASLRGNHYYLYFGVTPAVTVFLPYAVLTGRELRVELAVAGQATLGCWIALWLLLVLRAEFFPRASGMALTIAGLALALATAVPVTLRKSEFYEAACTAGFLWSTALMLFMALAVVRPSRRALWLALASLSLGLAVGSRPNLLVGAGALGGLALWLWWRAEDRLKLTRWRWLAAAILPAAVCGAVLALYNYARFGDPLEFGHRFQVGSVADNYFSLRYFPHNLSVYYLTPPSISWFFPFFSPGHEGSRPLHYMGIEYANGQWFLVPWMVAAAALGVFFLRRLLRRESLAVIVAAIGFWFVANFALVGSISARANRYMLDFHPALVLLGCLALLACSNRAGAWRLVSAAGSAVLLVAVVFNLGISFQVHDFFRLNNPRAFAAMERWANRLVWPWHRVTSPAFGAVALDVVIPDLPAGRREPLLSTGAPLRTNTLTLVALGRGRARLEFDHEGHGGPVGPEFRFEPGRRHEFKIWLGSLVPPFEHPWFEGVDGPSAQMQKQNALVQLDGRTVYLAGAIPYDASPGQVTVGARSIDFSDEEVRFTGQILQVRRLVEQVPVPGPKAPEEPLVYRLDVRLPRDRFGAAEPLLATGVRGLGDTLLVEYSSRETIRIGHDQLGGGLEWSEALRVDYEKSLAFEFAFERTGPVEPFSVRGTQPVVSVVRLGGREVFRAKYPHLPFVAAQVAVGCNTAWASSCRLYFGGTILFWEYFGDGISRIAAGRHGWAGTRAELLLPFGLDEQAQPLLAYRNQTGAAGLLALRSAGTNQIQLGWIESANSVWSEKIPVRAGEPLQLEANWRSVAGAPAVTTAEVSGEEFMRGRVRFRLNHLDVFQPRLSFFESAVVVTAGWRRAFEAQTPVLDRFAGKVELAKDRTPPTLITGRVRGPVPRTVRMVVQFPMGREGVCEPLLTTGRTGAADGVYVRYGMAGKVSLGFDHWGVGGPESAPVEIGPAAPHELEIVLGDGGWERAGPGRLSVRIDGRVVIDAPARFHAARPGEIVFGENPVGLSTSVREFTGVLISLEGR